MIPLDLLPYVR
jgi:hypothetical protein